MHNKVDEAVLADLKYLLLEAKQKLPPFLASLETEYDQFAGNSRDRGPGLQLLWRYFFDKCTSY